MKIATFTVLITSAALVYAEDPAPADEQCAALTDEQKEKIPAQISDAERSLGLVDMKIEALREEMRDAVSGLLTDQQAELRRRAKERKALFEERRKIRSVDAIMAIDRKISSLDAELEGIREKFAAEQRELSAAKGSDIDSKILLLSKERNELQQRITGLRLELSGEASCESEAPKAD